MHLTPEIAAEIVSRARLVLRRKVIITDATGVAVGDSEFRGQTLVDALRACQEGRVVRASLDDSPIAWCPFVYEHQTIGTFGVFEDEAQVTPEAISLLQGLAEVITHQHFLLEHIQPSEKMQANFLKQALTSGTMDAAEIYRQADILQMNLRIPQAVILIHVDGFQQKAVGSHTGMDERDGRIHNHAIKISKRVQEAFQNNSENIACYLGDDIFLLSKGIGGDGLNTRNTMRFLVEKANYIHDLLREELKDHVVTVGVGQYYPDLGGLRKGYQEAKLSLTVGSKVWGPGRTYHIKQVGMFVTLANVAQEHKAELAHQILYPLLRDEQLYKTVQTFLSSGLNLTEAAEKLHVHRNTLIYRLDKTKKVIGLDPRVFDDALQIKLGLMFYQEA
jgi:carbohydrate diacid regulator